VTPWTACASVAIGPTMTREAVTRVRVATGLGAGSSTGIAERPREGGCCSHHLPGRDVHEVRSVLRGVPTLVRWTDP
jgi:hypothetical protein